MQNTVLKGVTSWLGCTSSFPGPPPPPPAGHVTFSLDHSLLRETTLWPPDTHEKHPNPAVGPGSPNLFPKHLGWDQVYPLVPKHLS